MLTAASLAVRGEYPSPLAPTTSYWGWGTLLLRRRTRLYGYIQSLISRNVYDVSCHLAISCRRTWMSLQGGLRRRWPYLSGNTSFRPYRRGNRRLCFDFHGGSQGRTRDPILGSPHYTPRQSVSPRRYFLSSSGALAGPLETAPAAAGGSVRAEIRHGLPHPHTRCFFRSTACLYHVPFIIRFRPSRIAYRAYGR